MAYFATNIDFTDALDSAAARELLPSELRSRALEELPTALRDRALFSAGVSKVEFLEEMQTVIQGMLDGTIDRAQGRQRLYEVAVQLGAPPDPDRTERDVRRLTTDARLNLILDTNVAMARGRGQWEQGNDPDLLRVFPAWELIRAGSPEAPRPWRAKWRAAGGRFYGGRMIARKDDPIWTKPITAGGFNRFGHPYPPFDYNSTMDVIDVSRSEAIELGVIQREDPTPEPTQSDFNTGLQGGRVDPRGELAGQIDAHFQGLAAVDPDGVLRWRTGQPNPSNLDDLPY